MEGRSLLAILGSAPPHTAGTGAPPYQNLGCFRGNKSYAQPWANTRTVSWFAKRPPAMCSAASLALNANTDLLTITIGGNDIGFADVMATCTIGSNSSCLNAVNDATNQANTTLPARLDATYAAIRAAAPNAQVVVLGYPRLVSPTGSRGLLNLSTTKRTALNNGADLLDAAIAARVAAAGAGFTYVSSIAQFNGHGARGSSAWINKVQPVPDRGVLPPERGRLPAVGQLGHRLRRRTQLRERDPARPRGSGG